MLDKDVLSAKSETDFLAHAGKYFVNMEKAVRTLHITGCSRCQYSRFAYKYISFESLNHVKEYELRHNDATPFKRCGKCFTKR